MRTIVTAQEMREAEQAVWDVDPNVDLMARAAVVVAEVAAEFDGEVLVVVGPGNNGGDGLFAAAVLARSRSVKLWLATGGAHEAGLQAARGAGCEEVDVVGAMLALSRAGVVIDAFTGLGSRPGLPDDVLLLADACRDHCVPVVSVDHPSGLATDSPVAHPSFHATITVTFAALKPCHVMEPAASACGDVRVVDIGVPVSEGALRVAEEHDVVSWYPFPGPTDHKYTRGVVLIETGSEQYPGAAVLNCSGALHVGTGMVRYSGAAPHELILGRFPSVVIGDGRAQAVVVGSGWDGSEILRDFDVPVVADAGALEKLPDRWLERWLLTPHPGELAKLLGVERREIEEDPVAHVRSASTRTGATVLLKGATQYVAEPSGRVTIPVSGPAWTAQAGSGDVLAGMCGALLAAGLEPWRAATVAASFQAMTAARFPGPFTPDEIAERLPQTIGECLPSGD